MKTIGYKDKGAGKNAPINVFNNKNKPEQKRHDRFKEAWQELRHTGNILIYSINGNKIKCISNRTY
ncbi:MAG TPA: hypothetical protein PLX13_13730 [Saprospiraceae bacterium]|nr:hypothetical protein [Saprospiraceae bacterium]HNG68616.1 hypothetical protein [Saprospiraceae bacterium]